MTADIEFGAWLEASEGLGHLVLLARTSQALTVVVRDVWHGSRKEMTSTRLYGVSEIQHRLSGQILNELREPDADPLEVVARIMDEAAERWDRLPILRAAITLACRTPEAPGGEP